MNEVIWYTIGILVVLGGLAAVILYFVSRKFYVKEDPRLPEVMDALPATNCGGCGYPGCAAFAQALIDAEDLDDLHCPVGGNEVMEEVAEILGKEVKKRDPYVAVVRCAGSFEHRKKTSIYEGASNCLVASTLYSGDRGCAYGCVGLGDCVDACDFEAMYMDETTGLPVVIDDKCTACNACVTSCPKDIIQLWPKGRKSQRIYVACVNEEKAGVARKECAVACSGCSKCFDECKYDAIKIVNNLAIIDYEKCNLCARCVDVCESHNIMADNVPAEKLVKAAEQRQKRKEREEREKARQKEAARAQVAEQTDADKNK